MDFIRLLPLSNSLNIIVVITDYLSKGVLLAPYLLIIILEGFAKLFILLYYILYRLLRAIISNRGP